MAAVNGRPNPRRTFINASAIGYYGVRGDETLDETAPPGSGFLAEVVKRWEEVARRAEGAARLVILRFGVVLGPGAPVALRKPRGGSRLRAVLHG